jgi:hypothetical protein
LAPGFLRRLFGGFSGGSAPAQSPPGVDPFDPTGGRRSPD